MLCDEDDTMEVLTQFSMSEEEDDDKPPAREGQGGVIKEEMATTSESKEWQMRTLKHPQAHI